MARLSFFPAPLMDSQAKTRTRCSGSKARRQKDTLLLVSRHLELRDSRKKPVIKKVNYKTCSLFSNPFSDYSLIIDDVQIADEATFECQVTKHQLRSRQAHLTVLQPPQDVSMFPVSDGSSGRWPELDGQEGVLSVVEDEITKLRCVASSSKPATVLDWSISG